jgi:hypothetical protein
MSRRGFTAHFMPEDIGAPKGYRTYLPVLVADRLRFAGDRVAFIAAGRRTHAGAERFMSGSTLFIAASRQTEANA